MQNKTKYPDFDLAKHHRNYDENLEHMVAKQPQELVQARATEESRKLYNMHRQVGCEIHRIESFTRLKTSDKGILFARINPEHNVEEFAARFFMNRFPSFIILLESKRGCFIVGKPEAKDTKNAGCKNKKDVALIRKPLKEVLSYLESVLPDNPALKEIREAEKGRKAELWDVFYNTQFIKERENKRYFHRSMPRKLLKDSWLETEARAVSRSKDLRKFFSA